MMSPCCSLLWPSSEGADHEGSQLHEQLHPSACHHPEDPPGVSATPSASSTLSVTVAVAATHSSD